MGTITTLIFKGSGLFSNAPALGSKAGLTILASVVLMIIGVLFVALAGFGRGRQLQNADPTADGFGVGLVMMVISGLLVGCMNFAFVYGQDSILGNLSLIEPGDSVAVALTVDGGERFSGTYPVDPQRAITLPRLGRLVLEHPSAWRAARQVERQWQAAEVGTVVRAHVETGSLPATFAACTLPLLGGTLVICGYAVFLLFRNRTWGIFAQSGTDLALVLILGLTNSLSFLLWGKGTLMLGAVGASIGWGISQATKVIGSQGLGYLSGEWRGVRGAPLFQMRLAAVILIVASVIMAYGKTLSTH